MRYKLKKARVGKLSLRTTKNRGIMVYISNLMGKKPKYHSY